MNIIIISASSRRNSESFRVASYIEDQIRKMKESVEICTLKGNPIPLWEEKGSSEEWKKIGKKIDAADGFVIVVPEWNGSMPPGLKNLFVYADDEFAHKPCLLVGVTAGLSGVYPLIEMRIGSYKNSRICYLPEQIVIKNVMKFLKGDTPIDEIDKNIRDRITYCIRLLLEYTRALYQVRDSGVIDHDTFPSGM